VTPSPISLPVNVQHFQPKETWWLSNRRRCGVQRISRRNGVMGEDRARLLDEIEFDWTGADPLS